MFNVSNILLNNIFQTLAPFTDTVINEVLRQSHYSLTSLYRSSE